MVVSAASPKSLGLFWRNSLFGKGDNSRPKPSPLGFSHQCKFDRIKVARNPQLFSMESSNSNSDSCFPRSGSITHVIFDMDGLLLDTERLYSEVHQIVLARYNKTFDWSLKAKLMGTKATEAAQIFVIETGLSDSLTADDFLVEREEMFPTSELMPGASRLIRHLHSSGIPICVATGHGELFSLMHHIVMGDDPEVNQGKPSPDVFLVAAKRFKDGPVNPQNILVFEDAPAGVLAAKSAGMYVVMVPDPGLDNSYHKNADKVLISLLDFKPNDWGLPPFGNEAS